MARGKKVGRARWTDGSGGGLLMKEKIAARLMGEGRRVGFGRMMSRWT